MLEYLLQAFGDLFSFAVAVWAVISPIIGICYFIWRKWWWLVREQRIRLILVTKGLEGQPVRFELPYKPKRGDLLFPDRLLGVLKLYGDNDFSGAAAALESGQFELMKTGKTDVLEIPCSWKTLSDIEVDCFFRQEKKEAA